MNLKEYKELLKEQARISDVKWNPSEEQLKQIQSEIDKYIKSGRKIGISTLQQIITSICGPVSHIIFESVDNSDLNMLLALATSNTQQK
ncbi:hypothetical protein MZA89_06755 [Haemophilus influenzae]|nr:hypothetical protein [Haemophilus influenzae]MCK9092184.1 hypothetical protein [Haemophilus influenzae]MCK9110388.1 hypothetical protein [Haemophilus influenzae]